MTYLLCVAMGVMIGSIFEHWSSYTNWKTMQDKLNQYRTKYGEWTE